MFRNRLRNFFLFLQIPFVLPHKVNQANIIQTKNKLRNKYAASKLYALRRLLFLTIVGLSMILYTIIRKEFNGRKPAQRTHRTMIRTSEMVF